ncbi:MAG: imidazole glycerol phosphate synthase subunit HisH [Chloroflexi bacterium]|nr:imidazole glycerol phosphate synthase subunit HisH [Chloroflexota bacterium]
MNKPKITIIDYQASNLRSVQKALEANGATTQISDNPKTISQSDAIVFPGQGAIDPSMKKLNEKNLIESIKLYISNDKPFLGICLGLQLLFEFSDEGKENCLGILKGNSKLFPPDVKTPHIGWNQVEIHISNPLFNGIKSNSYFYFVHSYYALPKDNKIISSKTDYGVEFCSSIINKNLMGVQFHPEKSGPNGLKVYNNFIKFIKDGRM